MPIRHDSVENRHNGGKQRRHSRRPAVAEECKNNDAEPRNTNPHTCDSHEEVSGLARWLLRTYRDARRDAERLPGALLEEGVAEADRNEARPQGEG